MASITQTIPQYSLGMSEQPDQLKFPGQVKEVTNAIPDLTKGLFKRPGSKRIGTTELSSVQSGGSWFHYFRDETEGSYIGQVAADGQVRVWSCETGALQTTLYGAAAFDSIVEYTSGQRVQANNKIYEAQATINSGGSAPSHSSGTTNNWLFIETASASQTTVQNYLATSAPENLQFLTINDTTFVNSRDTTNANTLVGTTGTTDNTPDAHFGFIELLRTENGRQYGVNVNNSTVVTTVSRATKIKVESHDLDQGDGSGHCPGIGTEVFSVTAKSSYPASDNIMDVKNSSGATVTSGKENLIFRINALGQQGVSPNYTAAQTGPGGQNYRCSYNIETVLLHGGEGWAVGDTIRTQPAFAYQANSGDGQAIITIRVTEVETTQVNATITANGNDSGLIRPSPTPFDSDTAVTADTIIGGIIDDLPASVTGTHIGTGIYLSSANPFTVEVVEEDLMRCFQSAVNDVQALPNQCKHGYIVKVSNALRADEDDYYLRFEGENEKDGSGSWVECAKPNIAKELTNMPLVIQRTGFDSNTQVATFTVRPFDYQVRRVGDDTTNPMPSFVGSRINKVLFFRNRLALLSGENVITSRPGTLGLPDFFVETALTVSAADPIDISAASMFPSELFDGIEMNTGLVVFSTNQQFLLASDDTVLNPDTAKLRSVATFNYNEDLPPISLGTTLAYIDNSGKFSRLNEMANVQREGEPSIVEVSKVVPTLIPKDADLLTNSRENSMILIGKTNSDEVFGFKYFQVGEQRQQAAWFKWKLNNPLIYHFIINDEYFFLDSDYYLQSIKLVQADSDPSIIQDNVDFLLHLDNHSTLSGGSFNSTTNTTTFSGVDNVASVTTPNHDLVVIDTNTNSARVGRYGKPTNTTKRTNLLPSAYSSSSGGFWTVTSHGLETGDEVFYYNAGGTDLALNGVVRNSSTPWYVIKLSDNTFTLAHTFANATSNPPVKGVVTNTGNNNQYFISGSITLPGQWTDSYIIGYLYPYEVKFPTFYPTKTDGKVSRSDVNSSLVLHRLKLHFGKIGLYETTLERVGKNDYTEVYESTELDEYDASDAPYLEEFIKTVPVYEKNTNVDVTLKSSHPAPATLRALSWEGDYSPKFYKRV